MSQATSAGGAAAPAGGFNPQQSQAQATGSAAPATAAGASGTAGQSPHLNQIVTDYLMKRGYVRTEATFRQEIRKFDSEGKVLSTTAEDLGPAKYLKVFERLKNWIDNCLDIYKFELEKLLWPFFVYSYLDLIEDDYADAAADLLQRVTVLFETHHADDIHALRVIRTKAQVYMHATISLYRRHKYKIPLSQHIESQLWSFLDHDHDEGGSVVSDILNRHCTVEKVSRGPINPYSFEAIYRRGQGLEVDNGDALEGIPGAFTGVSNRDILDNHAPVKLGHMPMDPELTSDLRAELEEADSRIPPPEGKSSLVDAHERKIKLEESADAPIRGEIPLPPSRARDVVMEMQKVREYRDRLEIKGMNDSAGPGVSICMFTFHNSLGAYTCIDFSADQLLAATGTEDSYIRVWSLDGNPLRTKVPSEKDLKVNNRKLVGHSDRVYSVHFSNAASPTAFELWPQDDEQKPEIHPRFLVSASADGQVRLWSLETWSCLCVYKSHIGPVLRVLWSPHGHYFASAGWDKTVRIWSQEKSTPVRLLVGHDTSISAIAWHPNGVYIFSASDEMDKTIRMWDMTTGQCVRTFTGHGDYMSALAVAPNGRILASADIGGSIYFWDIEKGSVLKRSRGHRVGGIWSLSFSMESTVLVSGGADGTLRLWDVASDGKGGAAGGVGAGVGASGGEKALTGANAGDGQGAGGDGSGAQHASGPASLGQGSGQQGGGSKKKGKELTVTPDQIGCFLTKRTPVIQCEFTRMNLVVAGGWYDPER